MKRYLYTLLSSVMLLGATILTGCTNDSLINEGNLGDGKLINATFTLSPEFVEEITVRSITGVNENVIKDLWVVQLNANGTAQLQEPKYITTGFTTSANDYKVSVSLKRESSKIYFIANTHNDKAYTTAMKTSVDVEAVAMTLTGEANLASADGIPMSGVWTGTPDLLGIAGRVFLSRAIAKVNFNLNAALPAKEVFTLKSITVKLVPSTLNYYRDAVKLDAYPYPATPAVITDYSIASYNEILNSTSKYLWWYLPENARGTGTATIQMDKGSKIPSGQSAYCTYIEVAGRYEAGGGTYNTTYRIYLGANNTNDYNLKRNTVYNINTTIRGIDAADTRINTVDKSIIIGPFGGWDDTKKEYTKLLEVKSVAANASVFFLWSSTAETVQQNATNIHYGLPNIEKLQKKSDDLSAYPAAQYCAKFGNGWYLPSQNQLMAIWAANNGIPTDFSLNPLNSYWSSTESDNSNGIVVYFADGATNLNAKSISHQIRCVRDITPKMALSSMVVTDVSNRAIIDCRNLPVGAVTTETKARIADGALDKLGTNDLTNIGSAESNKTVSHYFEVMKSNLNSGSNWLDAANGCSNYKSGDGNNTWRLPTQRELYLLWILNTAIKPKVPSFTEFSATNYWSATETNAQKSFAVAFTTGIANAFQKGSVDTNHSVRCVRDLTPPAN